MFNLLPFEEKKKIRKEYRRRIFVLMILILIMAVGIMTVLLMPAVVFVMSQEKDLNTSLLEYGDLTVKGESSSFNLILKETSEKLTELSPDKNKAVPLETIIKIVKLKPEGLYIEHFTYKSGKNFVIGDFTINGRSDTRDALLLFRKALESEPSFSAVNLPVSNFAQERNIPFSINVTASFDSDTTK